MPSTTYKEFTGSIATVADRTDTAGTPVSPDFKGEEFRMLLDFYTAGILSPQDGFEVVAGGAATMDVVIGSGSPKVDKAIVAGDSAGQGKYLVRNDDTNITVTLDPADGSNPRFDAVYLIVADAAYDGGSVTLPRVGVRKGDPASSPSLPGPDSGWDAYLLLATINIPAGAADILDNVTISNVSLVATTDIAGGGFAPIGSVIPYAGATAPVGWLLAQGQAISRTDFSRLFAAIGTAYGVGDGSTTFNLPDLRQRFPLGKAGSGTGSTLGGTGGNIDHTHTTPNHTHDTNPPGTESGAAITGTNQSATVPGLVNSAAISSTGETTVEHTVRHTHSTNIGIVTSTSENGGPTGLNNPPFQVLNYIVKV